MFSLTPLLPVSFCTFAYDLSVLTLCLFDPVNCLAPNKPLFSTSLHLGPHFLHSHSPNPNTFYSFNILKCSLLFVVINKAAVITERVISNTFHVSSLIEHYSAYKLLLIFNLMRGWSLLTCFLCPCTSEIKRKNYYHCRHHLNCVRKR